jgi:hypothetical protein
MGQDMGRDNLFPVNYLDPFVPFFANAGSDFSKTALRDG